MSAAYRKLYQEPGASTRHKLAVRAFRIPGEGAIETLSKALKLEAQGHDIVHLEIGESDFHTPEHIVEAGLRSIRSGRTRYGPAQGIPEIREGIAQHLHDKRGISAQPGRVIVTPGAKPVIFLTVLALVESGDEVILPNPGFPAYAGAVQFVGGVPVALPLNSEGDFRLEREKLLELVTERTKLIIINSPGNPTGAVLSRQDLEAVASVAIEHDLWVLADEIYSELYYDSASPMSIAALPGMLDRTILLNGFSKTYAMTGWRLGYGHFPEPMMQAITNMVINGHTCVPMFVQDAGVAALMGPQDCVTDMREKYRARKDLALSLLRSITALQCNEPAGAFYMLPRIKVLKELNIRAFTDRLLEFGVAVLPGTDFGTLGVGSFRMSFAGSRAQLREGIRRISTAMESM